jgi:hypothetical protein
MQRNCNESKSSSYIFTHAIIDAIFKYILHVKTKKHSYEENNIGVLRHIKAYNQCYETRKNGSLCIHTNLLWLNDTSNPNIFMQTLHDDEKFQE